MSDKVYQQKYQRIRNVRRVHSYNSCSGCGAHLNNNGRKTGLCPSCRSASLYIGNSAHR